MIAHHADAAGPRWRKCAWRIRRYALRMGEVQGQGYIGQALGWADVLAVAYGHALKLRPAEPAWEGRDRFLLSHGHYAIAHYAALIEAGVMPESELETYGSDDSRLPMSGMASYTPGMEISGGSLGQGLVIGVGMALALKHKRNPAFVYNSHVRWRARRGFDLGGRDVRRPPPARQPDLPGRHQQPAGRRPLGQGAGLRAAGRQVGGLRLARAARRRQRPAGGAAGLRHRACTLKEAKPRVILFDTLMGKGVPFLEQREKNHFIRVDPPEWQQALQILDGRSRPRSAKEPGMNSPDRRQEAAPDDVGDDRLDRQRRAARQGRALRQGPGRLRRQPTPRSSA
jgi:transketolase